MRKTICLLMILTACSKAPKLDREGAGSLITRSSWAVASRFPKSDQQFDPARFVWDGAREIDTKPQMVWDGCRQSLVSVDGVAVDAGAKTATADFTWKWEGSPCSIADNYRERQGPPGKGRASFRLFDAGWRLESVEER
jgi:hypothetical protein